MPMPQWKLRDVVPVSDSLASLSIPSLIKTLLAGRGFNLSEQVVKFLSPDYNRDLHDPFLFVQMEKVVLRINSAYEKKQKIAIYGDYDADGVTSSAIITHTLKDLGIESIVYIPDKKNEGYGLNYKAIENLHSQNISLIITVDCGITAIEEVKLAKELGIDVIITDHHHVPDIVPDAFAIINPHQEGSGYPFVDLAGVGVAFKLAQAIYERLMPDKKDQTKWMLDLVAIGTVADCVPLLEENRVMVKYGLIVLAKTRRIGLRELFTVGRLLIDENNIPDARKVAFHIAPRINAAGRIDHANLAYNLIMETDAVRGRDFALELEAQNGQRQKITEQIAMEVRILAQNSFKDKKFIFAAGEHFSIGVVGLVAGKIAQEYNKPVAIFQKNETESKGSFRSIPQINIIETIESCKRLVLRYGGHSQAAGVSVSNEKLEAFYEAMNERIEKALEGKELIPEITIEAEISDQDVDFSLLEYLEKLQPFGERNPEPIFLMRKLVIQEIKMVGNGNKHLKMLLRPSSGAPKIFNAIAFNSGEKGANFSEGDIIDIACVLKRDEWNGNNRIQFIIEDMRPS
jgi:single-stranded-DNA-specific exonuclease